MRNIFNESSDYLYFVFRIGIGLLFVTHGLVKLFGLFGKEPVGIISLFGAAGIIEIFVGFFIVIGMLTREFAALGFIEMIVAYFYAHVPKGFNPFTNGGELALMFALAFLALMAKGPGRFAVDRY